MIRVDLDQYVDRNTKDEHIYFQEQRLTIDRTWSQFENMQAFMVRGGDLQNVKEDDMNANNKQIAFFIFDYVLYYWMYGMEDGALVKVEMKGDAFNVNDQFDIINDSHFIVSSRTEKNGISQFSLYEIKVDFSTFEIDPIY